MSYSLADSLRPSRPDVLRGAMTNEAAASNLLFELTGVGVVETDLSTGRLVRANRAFCEWVGYHETELRAMTYLELTHPDDRARDAERFAALGESGSRGGTSLTRLVGKEGAVVWLELHVTVVGAGLEARNLTVAVDVTERERAKAALEHLNETLEQRVAERTAALARSNLRFSQAFYANPVPACMTTLGQDERFLEVNDAFLALTGYARDEVVGRTAHELGMWSSREDLRKAGDVLAQKKGFRELDLQVRHKDGEARDVLLSAETIQLDGQEGYLKMFYDVTRRKRTEEQTHQAIQDVMSDTSWFSQRVMERLAQLRTGGATAYEPVELTKRERDVLARLARGANNEIIAAELGVAVQTVRNYISAVYDKLGVRTRAEAIVWARERGIVG